MSRIPPNCFRMARDKQLLKDFFLKPAGLDIPTKIVYRPRQYTKFVYYTMALVRPSKKVNETVLVFKTAQGLSKPEIKQYFEKLYNTDVKKVNTARFMGKVYHDANYKPKRSSAYKKAFIHLRTKVEPFLNSYP